MKLTLTFEFEGASSSKGSGVASACGGRASPQLARLAVCTMVANSEPWIAEVQRRCSRIAREEGPYAPRDWIGITEATPSTGIKTSKDPTHQYLRDCIGCFLAKSGC